MYTIYKFGDITLPNGLTNYTLTPVPAQLNLTQTTSGIFDSDGTARRGQAYPHAVPYKATVTEDELSDSREILDALRAAVGIEARLYRTADDDGTVYSCMAILASQPHERPYQLRTHIFEITLEFQQLTPWLGFKQGAAWTFNSGVYFDSGRFFDEDGPEPLTTTPILLTRENNGNLPTRNILITIQAGANPLTGITIWNSTTQCYLRWTGTLPAGGQLYIDTGACLVLNNGFDSFNGLELYELFHRNQYWMEFAPGDNIIQVTRTGGGADTTIKFVYDETWA